MDSYDIPTLEGIDTVTLRVSDIQKSKIWYREKLGLRLIFEEETLKLAVFQTWGVSRLTLWETTEPITVNSKTACYPIFRTTNAELLRKELIDRDIRVDEITHYDFISFFNFYDADGNVIEACEIRPKIKVITDNSPTAST